MVWLKENRLNIIVVYLNLIFVFRVISICYRIKDFNYGMVTLVYFIAVSTYWFYSDILKKLIYKLFFSSALIFILAQIVYYKRQIMLKYIVENFMGNFYSINELLYKGSTTPFYLYKPYVFLLLPLISLLLLKLYTKSISEAVIGFNLLLLLLFWYLEYIEEVKSQLFIFLVLSAATYAVSNHTKFINNMKAKGINILISSRNVLFEVIIYSLIISLIVLFLPQHYRGKYTEETLDKLTNPFGMDLEASIGKAKQGSYGISVSGYNNSDKTLGGPLVLNSELAMQVKGEKAYYLRGDMKEIYTGRSWIKGQRNYEVRSDISSSDLNRFIENELGEYPGMDKITITITPEKLVTNTLFVPNYVSKVSSTKGDVYYESRGNTFINSGKVTKPYSIEFYDPDRVDEYLNAAFQRRDIEVDRIKSEAYLQVPEEVSLRTVELVYNIVKDYETNFEKVEAIRNYLSKNFSYSLEVSPVPPDKEFLDYFLFTEKKGYCTYFATAMTIMCRIAGIPARYVEGFKMPQNSEDGIFNITNEQAHAWSEVLYDNDPEIWVIKDCSPTPQEERERLAREELSNPTVPEQNNVPAVPNNKAIEEQKNQEQVDAPSINEELKQETSFKPLAATVVLSILAIYIIIRIVFFIMKRRYILRAKSNIPLYNYSLKRLKKAGIRKEDTMTDRDFIAVFEDAGFMKLMKLLVESVYGEFYGSHEPVNLNKAEVYEALESYIRQRQNLFVYLMKKVII
jgi:hypothetical protein